MKRLLLGFAALAAATCGLAESALAACSITLRNVTAATFTSSQRYSPFTATDTAASFTFQVRHPNGQATCNYFVTFSTGNAGTYTRRFANGSNLLQYQIYDSPTKNSILKAVPGALTGEVITGSFTSTALATHNKSYYVVIPALQVVVPSTNSYTDSITVRLYEGTLASYTQRDSVTLTFRAGVLASTQVCVACTTAFDNNMHSHEMNFGTLEAAETKSATVRVRTNEGYTLFLQSTNRSVLRHTTLNSSVAYTAQVNGVNVNLTPTTQVQVARVSGVTAAQGVAFDVKVIIGAVNTALAGNYADSITVTVTAF